MIPPSINELNQHSIDLAKFGEGLRTSSGLDKALVNVAVAVVALIAVTVALPPIFVAIV